MARRRRLQTRAGLALVGLCALTSPAIADAGQSYVSINAGGRILRVKPASIHLVSNENLNTLRWSSWGGSKARGAGMDHSNFPSHGRSASNPVRVELRDRKRCGSKLVYTTIRIRFTRGIPYAGEPSLISFAYGCPT